jgi:hypothetical protein
VVKLWCFVDRDAMRGGDVRWEESRGGRKDGPCRDRDGSDYRIRGRVVCLFETGGKHQPGANLKIVKRLRKLMNVYIDWRHL